MCFLVSAYPSAWRWHVKLRRRQTGGNACFPPDGAQRAAVRSQGVKRGSCRGSLEGTAAPRLEEKAAKNPASRTSLTSRTP
jgi:hypothetical protein